MYLPLPAIRDAQQCLKRYLPETRLLAVPSLDRPRTQVYLKLESELPTGSFKPRGALYSLRLNLKQNRIGEVVASSTGNHGAAVAWAAQLLRVPATIFLPQNSNPVKRARIAELGARIVEQGSPDLDRAFEQASAYAQTGDIFFLNDATDPDLPAGTATIACEIFDQLPQTDAIYVPMGDTALIRGIAAAARHHSPRVKIIGVQAERAPAYYLSWKQGFAVRTDTCDTIADGLATRTPDANNVRAIRDLVDDIQLVSEEQMLGAIRHLLFEEHLVAEPAGAATTAALLQSPESVPGGNVVLLVTGSNIAPEVLRSAVCTPTTTAGPRSR
jgi:threonine dehydratase